jgi:replicative DNA helicase
LGIESSEFRLKATLEMLRRPLEKRTAKRQMVAVLEEEGPIYTIYQT